MLKDEILERVNKKYIEKKRNKLGMTVSNLPRGIGSDQILSVIEVFSEILEEMGMYQGEIKRVKKESKVLND